jgi:hypothetical protein
MSWPLISDFIFPSIMNIHVYRLIVQSETKAKSEVFQKLHLSFSIYLLDNVI